MPDANATVFVVDDDPGLRASVGRLLRSLGFEAQLFESAQDFLKRDPPEGPACLVLDVRMPGKSGLEFQSELVEAKRALPIIFVTGHGDIRMSVQATKSAIRSAAPARARDYGPCDARPPRKQIAGHIGIAETASLDRCRKDSLRRCSVYR